MNDDVGHPKFRCECGSIITTVNDIKNMKCSKCRPKNIICRIIDKWNELKTYKPSMPTQAGTCAGRYRCVNINTKVCKPIYQYGGIKCEHYKERENDGN